MLMLRFRSRIGRKGMQAKLTDCVCRKVGSVQNGTERN